MKIMRIAVALALYAILSVAMSFATEQKTFATPSEAVKSLMAAVESGDQDALLAIFGDEGKDLISSGDAVQDKAGRDGFVKAYKTKHSIVTVDAKTRLLQVGAKDWQMPIPIIEEGGKWRFDTAAGKQELIYRRIGDNELGAIAACRGFIAAQTDYAAEGHDGLPAGIFAQRLKSEPGKQNGLYWEVKEGDPPSPAGDFLAKAGDEGYQKSDPYHGYYYRILRAQGAAAPGGAMSYLVDGQLKGKVALVAYPAQYKSSGVMTFIINQDGVVYQKDLGESTTDLAKAMQEYNPDKSWKKVTD
jgi:Protein of unknown function (DUF2950)